MPIYYDNQIAIFFTMNPTFCEQSKYIKIDCHYIQDKVLTEVISTPHATSSNQLVDIFTKSLIGMPYDIMCTDLDAQVEFGTI